MSLAAATKKSRGGELMAVEERRKASWREMKWEGVLSWFWWWVVVE